MKQKKKGDNMFWNTVADIRNLTNSHMNQKEKKHFNADHQHGKNKGQKMPINMLSGIRKKIINNYKEQKFSMMTENIQYDSSRQLNDTKFLESKLKNKKNIRDIKLAKNKYKFKDTKAKQVGKYSGGQLKISKKDINRINRQK